MTMKLKVNEISLPNVTRKQAMEIIDAIRHGGGREQLWMFDECKEKFPAYELVQILDAVFTETRRGVHFLVKNANMLQIN